MYNAFLNSFDDDLLLDFAGSQRYAVEIKRSLSEPGRARDSFGLRRDEGAGTLGCLLGAGPAGRPAQVIVFTDAAHPHLQWALGLL